MTTLRQRLLLVVGWVVAAVGIGLVSAGAVAVAGGQVTDRPLRPLSAAEVAALPVTTEEDCVTTGPLASGGSDGAACSVALDGSNEISRTDDSAQPTEREPGRTGSSTPTTAAPPDGPTPSSGETSSGETSSGETSSGETSSGETSSGETSSGVSGETSSGVSDGTFQDDGLGSTGSFPEGIDGPALGPRPPEPQVIELIGGQVRITATDQGLVLNGATPRPGYVADVLFARTDELTVTFWNGSRLSTIVATLVGGELAVVESESP